MFSFQSLETISKFLLRKIFIHDCLFTFLKIEFVLASSDHVLRLQLSLHATHIVRQVWEFLVHELAKFTFEEITKGLIYYYESLLFAGSWFQQNNVHFFVEQFVHVSIHIIHLLVKLGIDNLYFFIVKLIDLISFNLQLFDLKKFLTSFQFFLQILLLIRPTLSHLES